MAEASMADWVTAGGTAMAGLAAVVGVVVAWATANSWRAQARAAKEAEVGGAALVAATRFLQAVQRVTADRAMPSDFIEVHRRWREVVGPAEDELRAITGIATAYLPNSAVNLLLAILNHASNIREQQTRWAVEFEIVIDGEAASDGDAQAERPKAKLFREAFGDHQRAALDELVEKAVKVLRPLARGELAAR